MTFVRLFIGCLSLVLSKSYACDVCKEDLAQTVYDYQSIEFSKKTGNPFARVRFVGSKDNVEFIGLIKLLKSIPGVYQKTVHFHLNPQAAGFVYDKKFSFEEISKQFLSRTKTVKLELLKEDRFA